MMDEVCVLVISDMADLMAHRRRDPQYVGMDFVFSCRDGGKLRAGHYDTVYISMRASLNMSVEVRRLIANQRTKGAKICPVN
jgi:hypothetical protein